MNNKDDYVIDISSDSIDLSSVSYDPTITTVTIDDYIASTFDISNWTFETTRDKRRTSLRESGQIPVDIWAKMYNNNVIGTDTDD